MDCIITVHIQLPTGQHIKFPSLPLWSRSLRANFHGPCSLLHVALSPILSLSKQKSTRPRSSLYFSEGNTKGSKHFGCFQTINSYFPMWFSPGLNLWLFSVGWKHFIRNAAGSDDGKVTVCIFESWYFGGFLVDYQCNYWLDCETTQIDLLGAGGILTCGFVLRVHDATGYSDCVIVFFPGSSAVPVLSLFQ